MSIYGALFSGVSGLNAQSQSLGIIADNISNVNTVGYKTTESRFSTLVTQQASATNYSPGGVRAAPFSRIDKQGLLQSSESATDLAVNGTGFMVVNSSALATGGQFLYTRAGAFTTDAKGNLVNSAGYYLQGWTTDTNGVPTTSNTSSLSALQTINLSGLSGTATPTTAVTVAANLPATATTGQAHTVTSQIFDSLGVAHNIAFTFTKTSTTNQWTLTAANPTLATNSSTTTGTTTFGPATVTFNGDGTLASVSATSIGIASWTTGASNSTIALKLGTANKADGLSQFADQFAINAVDQNGLRFGFFSGVNIDEDGILSAQFDNGQAQKVFKIPVATFPNTDGLEARTGNAYIETSRSGSFILQSAGVGASGKLASGSLEASTVDLATEFTNMITTQRAYSASAQIITTANNMLQELIQVIR